MSCKSEVEVKTYTVTFDANGADNGFVPNKITVKEEERFQVPSQGTLSKNGYDFASWNTVSDGSGDSYKKSESITIDKDVTFYAQWTPHIYSIFYELDGGALPEEKVNPVEYSIETETFVLINPQKDGFEFLGWETSSSTEPKKSVLINKGTNGNLSFIAVWKALPSYFITYDSNGGEGAIDSVYKYEGQSVEIGSSEGISRKGYVFDCWNTKSDGTGTDYKPNDEYTEDEILTLYAKWDIVEYTISYDLGVGELPTGKENPNKYTIESETFVLISPEKDLYEFKGWKLEGSENLTAKVDFKVEKGTTGNLSLVAVWSPFYFVTYNANGGEGAIDNTCKYEAQTVEIASDEGISRNGYTFAGWNTKKDGSGTGYNPRDSYKVDADLTLYAKWEVIKYSLSYDLCGGTLPSGESNPTEYTVETDTFTLMNPSKSEEYGFLGWKESDSSDETAQDKLSIAKGSIGNKSFVAVWKKLNKCTVTFNSNGADGGSGPGSLIVYEESLNPVPACGSLYKDDCTFYGWNTDSNGNGVLYKESDLIKVNEDIILYAIWKNGSVLKFTQLSDSSYSVNCSNKNVDTSIVIPPTYKGAPVVKIEGSAFRGCTGLAEITIPEGVTSIGNSAFYDCSGLTSVTIPSSVMSIGRNAFYGCCGLTEITIPNSVTSIGDYAFECCSGLTSITIPENVTSIGFGAFKECSRLTTIAVQDGNSVYYNQGNCLIQADTKNLIKGFNDSIIPSYVKRIEDYAFSDCSNLLTDITIPSSVTSIGDSAFQGCIGLTEITIPEGVTSIGDSAFQGCIGLTEITIPEGVTSIGNGAFYCCSHLRSVTIASSVTSIGKDAFNGGRNLSIIFEEGMTKIPSGALSGVLYVVSVSIPNSVTSIGDSAFSGCSGLTSITIPNSVTSIGDYAFKWCSGLTEITIPSSVTSIGRFAFNNNDLASIEVDELNPFYYSEGNCLITKNTNELVFGCKNSVIPSSVTSIGNCAFSGCKGLSKITIPDGVTSIGTFAFYDCIGLKSVTIPSSVTSIGDSAFYGCTGLAEITIPEGVTSIGDFAFYDCSGLKSVTIPSSVTSIGGSVFYGCEDLSNIIYLGTKQQWNSISKHSSWDRKTGTYTIHCTDGDIAKN